MAAEPLRPLRVLLVEDSDDDTLILLRHLRKGGYAVEHERVDSRAQMEAALDRGPWDLVLTDYSMRAFNGLEALAICRQRGVEAPLILVSGTIGEEVAVEAMKAGAHDYIMKQNLTRLVPALEREMREAELRREQARACKTIDDLEDQLRHAQKLESLGRLAGGVAHDFNNLLTVILSATELARLETPPEAPPELHTHLRLVEDAAHRAGALTRQLLIFARRQATRYDRLDLNGVLLNLDQMLRRIIGEHIELRLQPGADLWTVAADPGQVEQVITNLVVNARDALEGGGVITLATNNLHLDEAYASGHFGLESGDHVELVVSDTGTGMSEEVRAHLFEPFFTTKGPGHGTGLGLATCYGIVQQCGGSIWCYSEPGQGTTFRIFLPRVAGEPCVGPAPEPVGPPRGGGETILLAEDEKAVRLLAAESLRSLGYRVLEASHGEEALAASDAFPEPIHLLVTDVVMPRMGGLELAARLRERRPGIRLLFASGYAERHGGPPTTEEEGHERLHKPYTPSLLARRVRAALDAPAEG